MRMYYQTKYRMCMQSSEHFVPWVIILEQGRLQSVNKKFYSSPISFTKFINRSLCVPFCHQSISDDQT